MRKMMFATAAVAALVGCGADVASDSAYSTDSWNEPTMNGELDFYAPQFAAFSETSRFHAWTFELTEEASVDIRTTHLARNLDTVMYLYEADAAGNKVGRYQAKNDDTAGTLASRIEKTLPAGRYLVQVKAHKTQITGHFNLESGCTGSGCPQPALPPTFTEQCDAIDDVVADCVENIDTLANCAPITDPVALQCCQARDDNYCGATCESGPLALDADLDFIHDYGDDYGHITEGSVHVVSCGTTFDQVIADARDNAVPENIDSLDTWPEGQKEAANSGILYSVDDAFFQQLATIAHDDHFEAWSSQVDLGCPSCTWNAEQWVLFYPTTGTVITLTGDWGHD